MIIHSRENAQTCRSTLTILLARLIFDSYTSGFLEPDLPSITSNLIIHTQHTRPLPVSSKIL